MTPPTEVIEGLIARLEGADRNALLWLPEDGTWRMEPPAADGLVEALCILRDNGDLAEEIQRTLPLVGGGFVHPWFWRLTPLGQQARALLSASRTEGEGP